MVSAPAGVLSSAAGPIQVMRPLSMMIAEVSAGGRPVPSIIVKPFNTRISPRTGRAEQQSERGGIA